MRAFLAALLVVFIIDTTTGDTIRIFDYRSSVQTWEQAREACRNLEFGQGWDLLQINDFENELITSLLRRECSDGTDGWWIRGTYSNFPGESNGDGRNNFAIYKNDFQSRSVAFRSARSSRLGYICEKQCGLDWPRTDGGSVAGTEEFGPSTSGRFGLTPFQRVRPSPRPQIPPFGGFDKTQELSGLQFPDFTESRGSNRLQQTPLQGSIFTSFVPDPRGFARSSTSRNRLPTLF